MTRLPSRKHLSALARYLLIAAVGLLLLLGFNAARLSLSGSEVAYAAANPTRNVHFTARTALLQPSGYTAAELNAWVARERPGSPLASSGAAFISAEGRSGISAQALMAIAVEQSAWGTVVRDNDVYAIEGQSYPSVGQGISDGAAWIRTNYLTPGGAYYVAPTLAGMGAHYATSASWATDVASIADEMYSPIDTSTPPPTKPPTPAPPTATATPPTPTPTATPRPVPTATPLTTPTATVPPSPQSTPHPSPHPSPTGTPGAPPTPATGSGPTPPAGGDPGASGNPGQPAAASPTPAPTSTSSSAPHSAPAPDQTCVPMLQPAAAPGLQPCQPVGSGSSGQAGSSGGSGQAGSGSGSGQAGSGSSGSGGATGEPAGGVTPSPTPSPKAGSPRTVAMKDVQLAASTGDGLAWPATLGGLALFLGLALLLLARRAPRDATSRRR